MVPSLAGAVALGEQIGVGVNVKYVRVKLAPSWYAVDQVEREGDAWAVDLGGEARIPFESDELGVLIRFAAVVQNLGTELEFDDEEHGDPLPRNVKLGASGQAAYGRFARALLCAQYTRSIVELDDGGGGIFGAGLEVEVSVLGLIGQYGGETTIPLRDHLLGRVGYYYDPDGEVEGISYGFGGAVELNDRLEFQLDFANVPQADGLERPWRIQASGWMAF
ncbi:MAG: hypothetical protein GF400_07625 [Candidatus Eisenbacteria bacterium]|nr:hypothetical protein [Candidatus Eisenbacteria bacterium]